VGEGVAAQEGVERESGEEVPGAAPRIVPKAVSVQLCHAVARCIVRALGRREGESG